MILFDLGVARVRETGWGVGCVGVGSDVGEPFGFFGGGGACGGEVGRGVMRAWPKDSRT